MNVFFHEDFYHVYSNDPAAEEGRMEAIVEAITSSHTLVPCQPAAEEDILAVHPQLHFERIRSKNLYEVAVLAAGGAVQAAVDGLKQPSFALIRPPGHHASAKGCWGFCFFNNIAISLYYLRSRGLIERAFVLDFDLHYGDGTVDILGAERGVEIYNPEAGDRLDYLDGVQRRLATAEADIFAVSAGFDNHVNDWGGLLYTADYGKMGEWVAAAARRNGGGCYGILEGGYNHNVLGTNVLAFLDGLST